MTTTRLKVPKRPGWKPLWGPTWLVRLHASWSSDRYCRHPWVLPGAAIAVALLLFGSALTPGSGPGQSDGVQSAEPTDAEGFLKASKAPVAKSAQAMR